MRQDRRRPATRSSGTWWVPGLVVCSALILALAILSRLTSHGESSEAARHAAKAGCGQVRRTYRQHQSGPWVTVSAPVARVLADSHGTSTHQRFVVRCPGGQTVLIVNNVDVGHRAPVHDGELVAAHGQYIWNTLGGLVHDTHHSTDANPNGWVLAGGHVYQ